MRRFCITNTCIDNGSVWLDGASVRLRQRPRGCSEIAPSQWCQYRTTKPCKWVHCLYQGTYSDPSRGDHAIFIFENYTCSIYKRNPHFILGECSRECSKLRCWIRTCNSFSLIRTYLWIQTIFTKMMTHSALRTVCKNGRPGSRVREQDIVLSQYNAIQNAAPDSSRLLRRSWNAHMMWSYITSGEIIDSGSEWMDGFFLRLRQRPRGYSDAASSLRCQYQYTKPCKCIHCVHQGTGHWRSNWTETTHSLYLEKCDDRYYFFCYFCCIRTEPHVVNVNLLLLRCVIGRSDRGSAGLKSLVSELNRKRLGAK